MDEVENPEISALGQTVPVITEEEIPTPDQPVPEGIEALGEENAAPGNIEPLLDDPVGTLLDIGEQKQDVTPSEQIATGTGTFKPPLPKDRVALPTRPPLKRDSSAPRPLPDNPAPTPESQDIPTEPPDSLTLADLRKLRDGFPITPNTKQDIPTLQNVYDFEYKDAQSFAIEIEEWFSYSAGEISRIVSLPDTYMRWWGAGNKARGEEPMLKWKESDSQELFVEHLLEVLAEDSEKSTAQALFCLCYLALGVFQETAGQADEHPCARLYQNESPPRLGAKENAGLQIRTMIENCVLMFRYGALDVLLKVLKNISDRDTEASLKFSADTPEATRGYDEHEVSDELWTCLTIIHTMFEVARLGGDTDDAAYVKDQTKKYAPQYLLLFTTLISKLRWDEASPIPVNKVFILHWKSVLLGFGGIKDVDEVKKHFKDDEEEKDVRGQPVITASPLDYHLFRQEIGSKYPAYQPPKPSFPFEPENNSILPPLRHRQTKYDSNSTQAGPPTASLPSGSIMHQPVHIATPAPSPPPSPGGPGGKGGKKQNYQTNQLFPFLYPPLDPSSNDIGGKGSTELQDALVGRKWQGSDVPASILEAAELFAKRMRATRAMKQLWGARVDFMKYDRGWKDDTSIRANGLSSVDDLPDDIKADLASSLGDSFGSASHQDADTAVEQEPAREDQEDNEDGSEKLPPLPSVANFYQQSLPFLQSYVIVSLKAVLKHVTDLVAANGGRSSIPNGYADANGLPPTENGNGGNLDDSMSTLDQIDNMRAQEITSKALTGSILLLLKWFKVSHILRYEYLTQLLLDSNYIPLVLKLWQTQDISRAVHFKLDRSDYNFFTFCATSSPTRRKPSHQSSASLSSLDSAAPPPIKYHRRTSSAASLPHASPSAFPTSTTSSPTDYTPHPPEIDELGYPQTPLPSSPITSFSSRNALALTSHLRILQKVTRRKAHRSLLLVSYKSSNHLKKSLRVPLEAMRYYTLKLFKSQVPYCGRKWRQSNMKIITAVWLSVPAELRDDWLVGGGGGMGGAGPGDVDGTVEEALPLEQSLRALTYWWNCRCYPEEMGRGRGMVGEDRGFFERELERMEGWGGGEEDEEEGEGVY
ncbi:Factor arrest protein 11 [Elsinoe australis]|uniref:Factor arrest protein 11 n=1 Tax=Elsinoe australis TaxID=40998 RepID=A0A2P7ZAJ1_9PEZI|nr:Factor arrest protein 11 [Elsinoe australis]